MGNYQPTSQVKLVGKTCIDWAAFDIIYRPLAGTSATKAADDIGVDSFSLHALDLLARYFDTYGKREFLQLSFAISIKTAELADLLKWVQNVHTVIHDFGRNHFVLMSGSIDGFIETITLLSKSDNPEIRYIGDCLYILANKEIPLKVKTKDFGDGTFSLQPL